MSRPPFSPLGMLCVLALVSCGPDEAGGEKPPPVPVSHVDLERYVGTWYELAKIPNRFQKDCARGTTAEYALREDGRISVVNRCIRPDGTVKKAEGVARVVDAATGARLKVSFVSFLGIRPFWGDYWILGLDADYTYAVVGTPDRKYGWILCRAPDPEPRILEAIWAVVREQGYDPGDFEATPH